jgi:8-oxo-dGTP pyrophosphatase MutT (NUDIX family)
LNDWLARLEARARQAPLGARVPLLARQQVVGSVKVGVLDALALDCLALQPDGWALLGRLQADITSNLNRVAHAMRDAQVGHVARYWRGEQLAVVSESGDILGSVERGAVRPLGIATRAVHLVGWVPDGRMWVQQRALTKANDPGMWDTMVGGMVPAQDSLQDALARETQEEAGLHLPQLHGVEHGGTVSIQKPSDGLADRGIGYTVERIDWFSALVPEGLEPVNMDGEVDRFELLERAEVLDRLHADAFTLEAALILVAALRY